jgi:hypothetical protein
MEKAGELWKEKADFISLSMIIYLKALFMKKWKAYLTAEELENIKRN